MPELFEPPTQPSFPVEQEPVDATIEDEFEAGYEASRTLWHRVKRHWKLTWINADLATVRYIRAFWEAMLGRALTFYWTIPVADLYVPAPATGPELSYFSGGANAQRTVYVVMTWLTYQTRVGNTSGQTTASPRVSLVVPANNLLRARAPRFPAGVRAARIYASTVSGSEVRQSPDITTSRGTWDEATGAVGGTGPSVVTTNTAQDTPLVRFGSRPRFDFKAPGVFDIEAQLDEAFG